MIVFKRIADLQEYLAGQRKNGLTVGFIPTMGALHKGHISLVQQAKAEGNITVCSIFVNPAQFNDKQDFDAYPSTIADDIALLEQAGCALLFLPSVLEIYPNGPEQAPAYHFGALETVFEGAMRPGHFNGVGKVMAILLDIVQADALYMGSKDYQQCLVVKDLCRQMGLAGQIRFVACPTCREPDGLAMSSRNRRLNDSQRTLAGIIYQCLVSIQSKFENGSDFAIVQKECLDLMSAKGFETEYVSLADADTLAPIAQYDGNRKMVALIATRIGTVRLIDNMIVN
jgi:pantoate--beta-alanine ligase